MGKLTHLNEHSEAEMVDISSKDHSIRTAIVTGCVALSPLCKEVLSAAATVEIISVARTAGLLAAKKTSDLIPHCHLVALDKVAFAIAFDASARHFHIECKATASGKTGVEMEAFVGAQIAAATIYDMIKAIDPAATVGPFSLKQKIGGKTGLWQRSVEA